MTEINKSLQPDGAFLLALSFEVGRIIQDHFSEPGMLRPEFKADQTPITAADREINSFVTKIVAERFPHVALICEEGDKMPPRTEVELIVDELDGTAGYARGMSGSVFAAAVHDGGMLTYSIISDPLAYRGTRRFMASPHGSFCNDRRLAVSLQNNIDEQRPTISVASWKDCGHDMMGVARELEQMGFRVDMPVSMSYTAALVASGAMAGVIFPFHTLWDVAPGDLLVHKAGGMTSTLRGQELRYDGPGVDGCIFSNGIFHTTLLEVMRKYY